MHSRTIQLIFFFTMFGLAAILSFLIFEPYINILVLAATFAIISFPLYLKIRKSFGNRLSGLSAFLTILIVIVIVGLPLTFLGMHVVNEGTSVYQHIKGVNDQEQGILSNVELSSNPILRNIEERFQGVVTYVVEDIDASTEAVTQWFLNHLGPFFQGVAQFVLAVFLWLLAFYYFLKDGHRIKNLFIAFSPLSDRYDSEIVARVVGSVKSVVGGSLIVALIQGVLAWIGFLIFGIPTPAIWGLLTVLAALVPTVGTGLVIIPAVVYLLILGDYGMALGLLIWGVVLVGTIDNFLRPKLIERGIRVHPLTILLAVLGGIAVFGPVGFLTGPIIISLLAEFINIYQRLVVQKQES